MWRYRQPVSGHRGYHTAADIPGARSMIEVLARAPVTGETVFPLVAITPAILSVPNNTRDQAVGYQRFVLRITDGAGVQRFSHAHPVLTLEASPDVVAEIADAYRSVAAGQGDFSVGPEDHNLWFWWWPGRARGRK
jgi:hypothetical protein